MTDRLEFTTEEKEETLALYQKIREAIASSLTPASADIPGAVPPPPVPPVSRR